MSLLNGFDATKIEKSKGFEPLPVGDYTCCISASEEKPTTAGTGHYLQLTIEVLDGEHKGRLLFERLNLDNPSAKAVEIAQETLAYICEAVGILQPPNAMVLHGKPMICSVGVQKRNDNGELRNRIKGYSPLSSVPANPPVTAGQPWATGA